jgi:hypothetical protein
MCQNLDSCIVWVREPEVYFVFELHKALAFFSSLIFLATSLPIDDIQSNMLEQFILTKKIEKRGIAA